MPYIKVVNPENASGRLARLYQQIAAPGGQVDNVLQIHSLRPHTLEGHMSLYKSVLHHPGNRLPVWFLEAIGIRVSLLNGCAYCARHHTEGLKRLLQSNPERFEAYRDQLDRELAGQPFTVAEQAALVYASRLTQAPGTIGQTDVLALKSAGLDDGEILEINQVSAYFAYANRTVSGLGVDTQGEVLGLSPGEAEGWGHG